MKISLTIATILSLIKLYQSRIIRYYRSRAFKGREHIWEISMKKKNRIHVSDRDDNLLAIKNENFLVDRSLHQIIKKEPSYPIETDQKKICYWESIDWIDLNIQSDELRPNHTLSMGQCFNWQRLKFPPLSDEVSNSHNKDIDNCWIGILKSDVFIVRQLEETTQFAVLLQLSNPKDNIIKLEDESIRNNNNNNEFKEYMEKYFQINNNSLKDLYSQWGSACPRMKVVSDYIPGVRVVRQDPFEV